jgi:glycosyltransferase involved in cell wall biosynthesis
MVVRPSRGGAFGHTLRLCRELGSRGYECAIAGPHEQPRGRHAPRVFQIEIPRYPHPLRHPLAIARLGAVYRRYRPHVVHAHGSQGGVIARLARIARPRTPVVFTPHNYAFTNYFTRLPERALYRTIEVALAPLATRVLCVCEAERRVAAKIGPRHRTRVVYNGIEPLPTAEPDPGVARMTEAGPLVSSVSELQPPKGVPTLIAAMPIVLRIASNANLAVAGDGVLREQIEAQVAELGVAGSTHLLGSIDNVPGLLGASDVYVQPGWSESFPYSILEAMSLARPIVATDVGGVGEAIEDGVTGRLVPPHDEARLAAAIVELISDPGLAKKLGEAARARMLARFSFDRMVDETISVYREAGLP